MPYVFWHCNRQGSYLTHTISHGMCLFMLYAETDCMQSTGLGHRPPEGTIIEPLMDSFFYFRVCRDEVPFSTTEVFAGVLAWNLCLVTNHERAGTRVYDRFTGQVCFSYWFRFLFFCSFFVCIFLFLDSPMWRRKCTGEWLRTLFWVRLGHKYHFKNDTYCTVETYSIAHSCHKIILSSCTFHCTCK